MCAEPRCAVPMHLHRLIQLQHRFFANGVVLAETFDFENTSVGSKADLPEGGQVTKVTSVVDGVSVRAPTSRTSGTCLMRHQHLASLRAQQTKTASLKTQSKRPQRMSHTLPQIRHPRATHPADGGSPTRTSPPCRHTVGNKADCLQRSVSTRLFPVIGPLLVRLVGTYAAKSPSRSQDWLRPKVVLGRRLPIPTPPRSRTPPPS